MRLIRASIIYFLLVFGTGFVLGTIRVLWLAPSLGIRTAELLEMPLMVLATVLAARWINRRYLTEASAGGRLAAGLVALVVLFSAELALGGAQGRSPADVVFNRDPVSGAAYYAALTLFGLMPWILGRSATRTGE